jgi:hypothetical protein
MVRVSPYKLPSLSLERTSQRSVGQVSWLAAVIYSLRLPKAMCLSGLCRFRSAYSCGAAMDLHHLPWSQRRAVTDPTSGIFNSKCELTAARPALSRTFLQGLRGLCLSLAAVEEDAHHRRACSRLHDAKLYWLVGGINRPPDAVDPSHQTPPQSSPQTACCAPPRHEMLRAHDLSSLLSCPLPASTALVSACYRRGRRPSIQVPG